MAEHLRKADWFTVVLGAAAGFNFAQILLTEGWFEAVNLVIFTALLTAIVGRLTIRGMVRMEQRWRDSFDRHVPKQVVLNLNEDGTASALVTTVSGDIVTYSVPAEIAAQGPEAAASYVSELVVQALADDVG